jgi:uncharacterized delta-60 repeat protein
MKAMRLNVVAASLAAYFSFGSIVAHAAPGDLDTAFGAGGIAMTTVQNTSEAYAMTVDGKGRTLVVGNSTNTDLVLSAMTLTRYLPDGTPDTTFGDSATGIVTITPPSGLSAEAALIGVRIDTRNRIVAGGFAELPTPFGSQRVFTVVRLNEAGQLDSSFGENGFVETIIAPGESASSATSIAIDASDRIVAAGITLDASAEGTPVMVRLNEDGGLDHDFGTTGIVATPFTGFGNGAVGAVLDHSGRIVLAGIYQDTVTFAQDTFVSRYFDDGSMDDTFGDSGTESLDAIQANAITLDASDRIVIAGMTADTSGLTIERLTSDGQVDTAFGPDGSGIVTSPVGDDSGSSFADAVTIDSTGRIIAVGTSFPLDLASSDIVVARYAADGLPDSSFGSGGVATFPSSSYSGAAGVVTDASDSILLTGYSYDDVAGGYAFTTLRLQP